MSRESEAHALEEIKSRGLVAGDTIHIDHDECGDTRSRLYITVKDDNRIVMWCHNCTTYGVGSDSSPRTRRKPTPSKVKEGQLSMADLNLVEIVHMDSAVGKELLTKYGAELFPCIYYEQSTDRYAFPIRRGEKIIGYQLRRRITAPATEVKYLTIKNEATTNLQQIITAGENQPPILVITEDWISSLQIVTSCVRVEVDGLSWRPDALPLLGTTAQVDTLAMIAEKKYELIVVWLDNDNPLVKKAANDLARLLNLMGPAKVECISMTGDPKTYGPDAKRELLQQIWNKQN